MQKSNQYGAPTRYSRRKRVHASVEQGERRITDWLAAHSLPLLRSGLGVVYLWFGALKFLPGASPAQGLAMRTTDVLTIGLIPPEIGLVLVATLVLCQP